MNLHAVSIKTRFGDFFETLERDTNGIALFTQLVGKEIYTVEQYVREDGAFCIGVFLDIFRKLGENDFDNTSSQVLSYIETAEDAVLEDVESDSLSSLVPRTFINEAAIMLPAMINIASERIIYVRGLEG